METFLTKLRETLRLLMVCRLVYSQIPAQQIGSNSKVALEWLQVIQSFRTYRSPSDLVLVCNCSISQEQLKTSRRPACYCQVLDIGIQIIVMNFFCKRMDQMRATYLLSFTEECRLVRLIHLSELEGSTMPPRLHAQICQLKVLIQLMLRTPDILVLCPQILTSCCTTQNSQSLSRQQNVQRFNHGRSAGVRDRERNHMKVHVPPSFSSRSPHSPGNSSFSNDMPWGNLRSVLRIVIESIFK